ncbi:MAG: nucleoside 2-deoxyribosyltransferase [bacterium]|nr:nucleoside 2-deoxyribosyltransferase [bacterium]
MKIYFAGSIRSGRQDVTIYSALITHLRSYGQVLSDFVGDPAITDKGRVEFTHQEIYDYDSGLVRQADALVADISTPSIGVGYEIGLAESRNIPIMALYREGTSAHASPMVLGNSNIQSRSYQTLDEAFAHLETFFSILTKQ